MVAVIEVAELAVALVWVAKPMPVMRMRVGPWLAVEEADGGESAGLDDVGIGAAEGGIVEEEGGAEGCGHIAFDDGGGVEVLGDEKGERGGG
jgi:hypothetical protein